MKRIVSILLILLVAYQFPVSKIMDADQIQTVQGIEDKKDKGEKESKKEYKDFVSVISSFWVSSLYKILFFSSEVSLVPSPPFESPVVPPDVL